MPFVFLSHSSKDKSLAGRIANDLIKAGVEVWLDEWEILIGDSITQRIQHGLAKADFVAVLLTQHSIESGWVEKEWQSQVGIEASHQKVVILPLRADDCDSPILLRDKKHADFRGEYSEAIKRLIEDVKAHTNRRVLNAAGSSETTNQLRQTVLHPKTALDVLIVEDEILLAQTLARIVQALGFSVAVTTDQIAVLPMMERWHPKIVIMDPAWISLSHFDQSLTKRIRELSPNTKIIALAGFCTAGELPHHDKFDAVIPKPATVDDIKHALNLACA